MRINIKINSLDNKIEKYIIKLLDSKPPECFKEISKKEIKIIKSNIKEKFNYNIDNDIIKSIKSLYLKFLILINHKNIENNSNKIIKDYNNKIDILKLTKKYNISPLNLLRFIFKNKYNKKLVTLIKSNDISKYDNKQLNKAIDNDYYCLINQNNILNKSIEFEKKIEKILKNNNIKFKTQDELVKEQIDLYDKPINTPDFLILSDLYINNFKINWIDAKNYYGIDINFYINNLKKQTNKYINEFGTGCIIYKNGFNNKLKINKILFIGYDDFRQNFH